MRFTKMQGLGNDFLLIHGPVPEGAAPLSAALCDRHFGVGADGVIFVSPSPIADCAMHIFNADGSEAKMCGNGIRCVGKYLHDKGLIQKDRLTVETLSGVKALALKLEDRQVASVSVDMGPAVLKQENVYYPAGIGFGALISVGNPHLVFFTEAVEDVPLYLWGPRIEADERFAGGVNAEFVQTLALDRLRMRVWERGCGITMACGTGACASAFAAVKAGLCSREKPVEVVLDGGSLFVTVGAGDNLFMEGPAVTVFGGEIAL